MESKITAAFFQNRTTIEVARDLLGTELVHITPQGEFAGYIVETEAYLGPTDQAAHSFRSLRTKRTEIMFHEPGRIYTYQMHRQVLLNFITMAEGIPEAVLIRAIEPYTNELQMEANRNGKNGIELTNGPGKLTQAMGIKMDDYGKSLFDHSIFLRSGKTPAVIAMSSRIGVPNKGMATHYPLRFTVAGNPYLSGKKQLATANNGWLELP